MWVCVTGYGIVDALGSSGEQCYANYLQPNTFTSELETKTPINTIYRVTTPLTLPPKVNVAHLSRNSQLALHAVKQACDMAGVPSGSNTAVMFASDIPHDTQELFFSNYYGDNPKRVGPRRLIDALMGASAALVSSTFEFQGLSDGVYAACASGLASVDYAMRCVDDYDYVVVGTAESPSPLSASLFNALGALSNNSIPFDKNRNGFVLGEGAGCLVLESEEKAIKRGARIYAKLYKPGMARDHGSDVAPDPLGRGAIAAMQRAMANAGIDDVDVVNAHATSTAIGDSVEYNAVRSITSAPTYSCKGKIGHLLTASNINELVYGILFSRNGHLGFNRHISEPIDGSINLPTAPIFTDSDKITTLKNSFGFGGRCVSMVMEVQRD